MGEDEESENVDEKKKMKQIEEQIKTRLRQIVDEAAYNRLMNVSVVNKPLFLTASKYIMAAAQKRGQRLVDSDVKSILIAIKQQSENETTITFHSK